MWRLRTLILLYIVIFSLTSMFATFPTPSASGEVPWKDEDRQWYYDNLNSTDRTKIRLAFDYLIPRDFIINQVHLGFATAITSPIGVNYIDVYEHDLVPRTYNLSKASELLTDVFGYIYDPNIEFTNESSKITPEPYFKITMICPTNDITRTQYASLISSTLNSVGIETSLEWWSWDIIVPRIFLYPFGTGYDYEHGGYDILLTGIQTSPDATFIGYYDKTTFPPASNWYYIEDGPATSGKWVTTGPGSNGEYPNVTTLWTDIYKEQNFTNRYNLFKECQQWCYDNVPTCIITQKNEFWALNKNLQGFDLFHGIQQQICNWTGIESSVTIALSGDIKNFNPLESESYFDDLISSNAFCSLARRRGDYNYTHSVPWLAENWTHSSDFKTWTVNLRQGIKWSDGTSLTIEDVLFTYDVFLNPETYYSSRWSSVGKRMEDLNYSCKKGINDYQVIFTLNEAYMYTETILFGVSIIQKAQLEVIPPDRHDVYYWNDHGTNNGSIPMIGCGPYQMVSYDGIKTVQMEKNPYYNGTLMGHNETMIGGGNWIPDPTITNITFEIVNSATQAILGLETGLYDVIDSQMGLESHFTEINGTSWGKILTCFEWGYEEMAFNHYNPIFGMNPHDPARMYPNRYHDNFLELVGIIFMFLFWSLVLLFPIGICSALLNMYRRSTEIKRFSNFKLD